jgi:hypothetical protein
MSPITDQNIVSSDKKVSSGYRLGLTTRKMMAQVIALPIAKEILPCKIPPKKPRGTKTAATVANLSRIEMPPNCI